MKKRIFAVVVITLLLILALSKLIEQRGIFVPSGESVDGMIQEIALRNSGQTLEVTNDQLYAGNLLLVNREYPIRPQGTQPDVTESYGQSELTGKAYEVCDYEVCYDAPDQVSELKVPADRNYAWSGDHRGGMTMTLYP